MTHEELIKAIGPDTGEFEYRFGAGGAFGFNDGNEWDALSQYGIWVTGMTGTNSGSIYRRKLVVKDVRIPLEPQLADGGGLWFMNLKEEDESGDKIGMVCAEYMNRYWRDAVKGGTLVISKKQLPKSVKILSVSRSERPGRDGYASAEEDGVEKRIRVTPAMADKLADFGAPCYVTVEPAQYITLLKVPMVFLPDAGQDGIMITHDSNGFTQPLFCSRLYMEFFNRAPKRSATLVLTKEPVEGAVRVRKTKAPAGAYTKSISVEFDSYWLGDRHVTDPLHDLLKDFGTPCYMSIETRT